MTDTTDPYAVTAEELWQLIERYEQLGFVKNDVAEQQKELMAEAKGRDYDTTVMRSYPLTSMPRSRTCKRQLSTKLGDIIS